ncbi:glycosyltransferase [bacterium]|nr:glycosyltransferase [bacterium]
MKISVLILTQNRQEELIHCVLSLRRELANLLEIIILDNGSNPPVLVTDLALISKVKLLRSAKNLGVAKGRNVLAQEARGDLLWFLDDDAVLETQEVCQLIKSYFRNVSLGVVSFKVINSLTGEEEVRCIPDRRKDLTNRDLTTSYFVGCSFVIRRKAFFDAGGFWEGFFYSCEELDLSYRLLELKYTLIRSSLLKVKHAFLPSPRRTSFWIYFNSRNRFWAALRNLPMRYVVSQSLLWWGYTGWVALGEKKPRLWFSALRDSIQGAPDVYLKRKVISHETLQNILSLGGRAWY